MNFFFVLPITLILFGASPSRAATQTSESGAPAQVSSMDDSQRVMGGMPTRAELKTRRARATNAPVAFSINEKTERLEARDIDAALIEEYSAGAVGQILDVGGYELKVSFGRDEHQRLSLLLRPACHRPLQ